MTSLVRVDDTMLALTAAGVRSSQDGGRSWRSIGVAMTPPFEVLRAAPGALWAGSAQGLFRSTDDGATWSPLLVGSRVLSMTFVSDDLALVGTEDDGVLRSEDAGRTWKSSNAGLQDLTVLGLAARADVVYAATPTGLFRSRNAGRAWRSCDSFPLECVPQCVATTESDLLVGTEAHGLLLSADGGTSWRAELQQHGVVALAAEADRVVAALDAGVGVTEDGCKTWRVGAVEHGSALTVAFASDGSVLAGLRRRGVLRSGDMRTWSLSEDGLAANLVVALAAATDGLFVAGLEDGIEVSSDGGTTWRPSWQADVAVFAVSKHAGYAASAGGVLRRAGVSWETLNAAPARAVSHSGQTVAALTLANEVLLSNDDGATWETLSPPWTPTCCAVAPNGDVLLGCHTGVYRATSSWPCVIEIANVRAIALANDGSLYVGTDEEIIHGTERAKIAGPVTAIVADADAVAVATTAGVWLLESG
ncbi:MAG: hypothetical protein JOZ81_28995, partial [Chloroflexi bacterium]|nr:hypothetical protein [Chloroflexota bacterium]